MTKFVKVCPKCSHHNPEYENICGQCQHFIGMEAPVKASSSPQLPETPPPSPLPQSNTSASTETTTSFYLESADGTQIYTIKSGWTIGQAHPSSQAEIQVGQLEGCQFIHRQHCRFTFKNEQWYLTAIDQKPLGREFTNPTVINQKPLNPGKSRPIKNGDKVELSNVVFYVRMV